MTLIDGILAVKNNGFVSLEIEGDSKIIIYCLIRRSVSLALLGY